MIQFECPHCQAVLRVPDSAMGQRGKCPKCQGTLLVPTPPGAASPSASATVPPEGNDSAGPPGLSTTTPASAAPGAPGGTGGETELGDLFSALSGPHPPKEDPLLKVTKRTRAQNRGSVLTGLFFLMIAIGLGVTGYFLMQPSLTAELTAELIPGNPLRPKLVAARDLGHGDLFRSFVRDHAERRIRMNSQFLHASLEAAEQGLWLRVESTGQSELYRVSPLTNAIFRELVAENYQQIETQRIAEFRGAVGEFLQNFMSAEQELMGSVSQLLFYRDRLILTGSVDALGYRLAAFVEGIQYPCIRQDREDRLYFALPRGTQQFLVKERDIPGQPRVFPTSLQFECRLPTTPTPPEKSPAPTDPDPMLLDEPEPDSEPDSDAVPDPDKAPDEESEPDATDQ